MTNLTPMTRQLTLEATGGGFVDIHTQPGALFLSHFDGFATHVIELANSESDMLTQYLLDDTEFLSDRLSEAEAQGEETGEQYGWEEAISRVAEMADEALGGAMSLDDDAQRIALRVFVESLIDQSADY